jgi:hypothetical protein
MVPTLTGVQPVTWQWLWSQHNEHRVPLPRLIMLAVMKPFGADFRGGMYFNVASVSLLAAVLMLVARRVRGRTHASDAFLPVVLLNWAQGLNFLWGWQVEFFTSTLLAGGALAAVAWAPRLSPARAIGAFLCLALAAMCGAHGVALLPAMGVFFIGLAVMRWRTQDATEQDRAQPQWAVPLILLGLLTLALIGVYMFGYDPVPWHPKTQSVKRMMVTSLQFLTMSFGSAVKPAWPVSGALMAALAVATAALLVVAFRRVADERERAAGLICFFGALVTLALGIGMGRDGLEPRYITLSVPAAAAAYVAWVLYGREFGRAGALVPAALLAVTLIALPVNTRAGLAYGRELATNLYAVRDKVRAGIPPSRLIVRHGAWLHPHSDLVMDYLPMLRDARVAPYDRLGAEPPFREVPVSLEPSYLTGITWNPQTRTATITNGSPAMRFTLPDQPRVAGIRLSYRHRNKTGVLPFVFLHYRKPGQGAFPKEQYQKYSPTGDQANWARGTYTRIGDDRTTMHTWIYDRVESFEIMPDLAPGEFEIVELTLLLPAEPATTTTKPAP